MTTEVIGGAGEGLVTATERQNKAHAPTTNEVDYDEAKAITSSGRKKVGPDTTTWVTPLEYQQAWNLSLKTQIDIEQAGRILAGVKRTYAKAHGLEVTAEDAGLGVQEAPKLDWAYYCIEDSHQILSCSDVGVVDLNLLEKPGTGKTVPDHVWECRERPVKKPKVVETVELPDAEKFAKEAVEMTVEEFDAALRDGTPVDVEVDLQRKLVERPKEFYESIEPLQPGETPVPGKIYAADADGSIPAVAFSNLSNPPKDPRWVEGQYVGLRARISHVYEKNGVTELQLEIECVAGHTEKVWVHEDQLLDVEDICPPEPEDAVYVEDCMGNLWMASETERANDPVMWSMVVDETDALSWEELWKQNRPLTIFIPGVKMP